MGSSVVCYLVTHIQAELAVGRPMVFSNKGIVPSIMNSIMNSIGTRGLALASILPRVLDNRL
jgi:hypothetical protein